MKLSNQNQSEKLKNRTIQPGDCKEGKLFEDQMGEITLPEPYVFAYGKPRLYYHDPLIRGKKFIIPDKTIKDLDGNTKCIFSCKRQGADGNAHERM